ncbi:MAG: hypothetical protein KME46_29000 [Brasilonema angustatum HA4187-MV1]|nr:hypothetical protein [Brasilonema angustatum HA4187-MV1]
MKRKTPQLKALMALSLWLLAFLRRQVTGDRVCDLKRWTISDILQFIKSC